MPEKKTMERARRAKRDGKRPTTQAGEFVREEMDHVKAGKHGVRSRQQAVAIGLSKARRAGVKLPPPKRGETSSKTRQSARSAYRKGQKEGPLSGRKQTKKTTTATSRRRATAARNALKRERKAV
jgi:hypothetical protein